MKDPLVSVIIPTYNRRAYVQEAIDSVLAQTYTDYEIIVIDDGSTDGTCDALRERYGDRIRYEWQRNQGLSAARNRGIELSRGLLIALLDSDDVWYSEKLDREMKYLSCHPDVSMVFSQARIIDAMGNLASDRILNADVTEEKLSLEALCFENCMLVPSSAVISRLVLNRVGAFDPDIPCYGEDYDLFMRMRLLSPIACVDHPLVAYRIHDSNLGGLTAENSAAWFRAQLKTLEKVFASWTDAPAGLKQRAVSWHHARAALMEGVVGRNDQCRDLLGRAVAIDTEFLTSPERFCRAVAGFAAQVYTGAEVDALRLGTRYVDLVLASLAAAGWRPSRLRRCIRARAFEAIGYAAHARSDRTGVLRSLAGALVQNPSLARNAGVWSILFEAVFGPRLSSYRRAVMGRARGGAHPPGPEAER